MPTLLQQAQRFQTRIVHRAHDELFQRVHTSRLIYNTCWEDPRLDRQMLALQPSSRVVMITSAGCNALDYLLDDPAEIHAVDMNPRQNALLELKLAVIRHGDYGELFQMFGHGWRPGFGDFLTGLQLPAYARTYWREKRHYFERSSLNPSFYYRGTAGQVAWLVLQGLVKSNPRVRDFTYQLLEAQTLEEQRGLYENVKPALWNAFNAWLMRQPFIMAMLGVPRPQIRLIEHQFPGGITGYIQKKVEDVLTLLPMRDNYFWRVYATGSYTKACCPNYLREEHQPALRARSGNIHTYTTTVAKFLRQHPGVYSHYVLLDHQDWLASHDVEGLREEWDLILRNSRPGTRILMRSAGPRIDFLPTAALERLRLFPEVAREMHQLDRVGTYGSTLLAEVL
ncbi:MAG: BtaA family protein [Bryobacteraceae bacterium]|nr:BtaA family protein [Bryobacteraceae bacterium]